MVSVNVDRRRESSIVGDSTLRSLHRSVIQWKMSNTDGRLLSSPALDNPSVIIFFSFFFLFRTIDFGIDTDQAVRD